MTSPHRLYAAALLKHPGDHRKVNDQFVEWMKREGHLVPRPPIDLDKPHLVDHRAAAVVTDPPLAAYQPEDFADPLPRKSVRAHCPHGGPVPCFDDLCHGVGTTLCGLHEGYDFCSHGNLPDDCAECDDERDDF